MLKPGTRTTGSVANISAEFKGVMTTITINFIAADGSATPAKGKIGKSLMEAAVSAGIDGIARRLKAPPATDAPYGGGADKIPTSLGEALEALKADTVLAAAFGDTFVSHLTHIKQAEIARHADAEDKDDWQRREYFSRI